MKAVKFHVKAMDTLREFAKPVRKDIGELISKLQEGVVLGMPASKAMPSLYSGAYELRLKDASGIYRVFYYLKSEQGILVFHAFTKKTQKSLKVNLSWGRNV